MKPAAVGAHVLFFPFVLLAFTSCQTRVVQTNDHEIRGRPVLKSEFIFETAPFRSCHASTIAETGNGLVAAWFGGTAEKNRDVTIWLSRHDGSRWTPPAEVATGFEAGGEERYPTRFPCWNPVLFQVEDGPLLLFYKAGPAPDKWWGMMKISEDGGKTWSVARRLPGAILGPIKNKPVVLPDGTLLCPSSTEHDGWRVHLERTRDLGATWTKSGPLNDSKEFGVIQPTILFHANHRLQLLCRSRQRVITECWSDDGGATWGAMTATALPNPNSGIDAVTLKNGEHLLAYNPVTKNRSPLILGHSLDGKNWEPWMVLESGPGEYSYPAIIQTSDGLVHVTYTWKRRRIKHVVLDPTRLSSSGILVAGAVKAPGNHWPFPNWTVLYAIDRAGGFDASARKNKIRLIRANGDEITVNGARAMKDAKLDPSIALGDIIIVPSTAR